MKASLVLFLCLLGVALANKCDDEAVKAKKDGPDAFIPECQKNGKYKLKQCWPSMGVCWCVDVKTGEPLGEPSRDKLNC